VEGHGPTLGEVAALLTAVAWAVAVILFRRSGEHVHPLGLNLFKSALAGVLFVPTIYLTGEALPLATSARDYAVLLVSGVLGIGVGDTLFFFALNSLGAGLIAIVDCLYSPFVIALSTLWLGERLTGLQAVGAVLIVSAVLAVAREGRRVPGERHHILRGLTFGVLALAAMAVGIVMVKPLLERSSILWVTEVRLVGGILSLAGVLALHPARRAILRSVRSRQRWRYTLSGSFVGSYVSMFLWLAGMKLAPASVAAVLNQTSNVFIFVFAALFLHERITRTKLVGIALGFAGAFLVMLG
jgi:drug/metabolite transporter (DMT)-like permease